MPAPTSAQDLFGDVIDRRTVYTYADGTPIEGRPDPLPPRATAAQVNDHRLAWHRYRAKVADSSVSAVTHQTESRQSQASEVPEAVSAAEDGRIVHPLWGHVATFYPNANPRPLVSFNALVWGPLGSRLIALGSAAKYGEPGYGLCFDRQLPHGATIEDAVAVAGARLRDALAVV